MNAFLEYLVKYVQLLRISDLIDILIVSVIVYYLINLIRETRAMQLVKGIIFLFRDCLKARQSLFIRIYKLKRLLNHY